MRFDESPALAEARLLSFLDFMHLGAGQPYVEVYQGPDPATPGGAPTGSVLLVSIELPRPIGTVSGPLLTMSVSPLALILSGGTAAWARWYNGDADWAGDSDVSLDAGTGFLRLSDTTLYAGARVQVMGGTIG